MSARAIDPAELKKLSNKAYRDAYLETLVRTGITFQIRLLRERLGLSQSEFAKKLGTTQSVVSRLENPDYGNVSVQTLLGVAKALDIGLLVRFCSYPQFLDATSDTSAENLSAEGFAESQFAQTTASVASVAPIKAGAAATRQILQNMFIRFEQSGDDLWQSRTRRAKNRSSSGRVRSITETSTPTNALYGSARTTPI